MSTAAPRAPPRQEVPTLRHGKWRSRTMAGLTPLWDPVFGPLRRAPSGGVAGSLGHSVCTVPTEAGPLRVPSSRVPGSASSPALLARVGRKPPQLAGGPEHLFLLDGVHRRMNA